MSRNTYPARTAARRDDRGSVLIFVVGILLLLAIIATAFLGSSRSDRVATQQNAYNTQTDLLLEGVVNAMKGAILADARYQTTANGFDSPVTDKFLASRVPIPLDPTSYTISSNTTWTYITAPQLDSNFSYPMAAAALTAAPGFPVTGTPPTTWTARQHVLPAALVFNGQTIPAFNVSQAVETGGTTGFPQGAPFGATYFTVPAMDTDGDGIADAGMVRLPIGTLAGVTYYYGARIVDLGSAVNVNTAMLSNDPTAATPLAANFYPSNFDLLGLLTGTTALQTTQFNALNVERTGQTYTGSESPSFNLTPVDDRTAPANRADFTFTGTAAASAEALWTQLGRRTGNPGNNTAAMKYKAFGTSEGTQLAAGFVVRDVAASDTPLTTTLVTAIKNNSPTKAYLPENVNAWFNSNFNFANRSTTATDPQTMPLRSLLTVTSPAGDNANSGGLVTTNNTWLSGTNYNYGAIVRYPPGGTVVRSFVCIEPHTAGPTNEPNQTAGLRYWSLVGWNEQPARIDANVADFGELWWGFRRLMATNLTQTLDQTAVPAAGPGRMFRNPIRDARSTPEFPLPPAGGGRYLSPSEVLQMRTAIAAVNAMDIRDSDTNVTARRIATCDFTGANPTLLHQITIFGTEAQPYITEVYYNQDTGGGGGPNPNGYVAVELHNPYPYAMNLAGWSLGLIDRVTSTPPRTVLPLLPAADTTNYPSQHFPTNTTNNVIIPANGYLVLENFNSLGAPTDATSDATTRPPDITTLATAKDASTFTPPAAAPATGDVVIKYVSGLARVISGSTPGGLNSAGGELVLLRPRIWDAQTGAFTYTNTNITITTVTPQSENRTYDDAEDPHNEVDASGVPILSEWVPVDSFDFTGMAVAPVAAAQFNAYHYVRANAIGAGSWKWTHGGPNAVLVPPSPGVSQVQSAAPFNGNTSPAFASAPVNLGVTDATASFTELFTATQMNPSLSPSPNRAGVAPTAAVPYRAPFGAFALQTDLLQIPFIGGYKVWPITGDAANSVTELNAMPVDFGFADDEDTTDDAYEQVGRFCPLSTLEPLAYRNWPPSTPANFTGPASPFDYYDFAYGATADAQKYRTIFDVFTTVSPLTQMLPAVGPEEYANAITANANYAPASVNPTGTSTTAPTLTYGRVVSGGGTVTAGTNLNDKLNAYKGAIFQVMTGASRGQMAVVTGSSGSTVTLGTAITTSAGDLFRILGTPTESNPTQGLININTAPWPVLARLPLAFAANGTVDHAASEIMARQIALFRDGNPLATTADQRKPHGPFRSIMDLNKVLDQAQTAAYFQTARTQATPLVMTGTLTGTGYNATEGDLTPYDGTTTATDNVTTVDYETRYLALSRLANLVTTRSDGFVVYVSLQGWRDANTANARLVTQRRAAFIIDRSGATGTAPTLSSTKVPLN